VSARNPSSGSPASPSCYQSEEIKAAESVRSPQEFSSSSSSSSTSRAGCSSISSATACPTFSVHIRSRPGTSTPSIPLLDRPTAAQAGHTYRIPRLTTENAVTAVAHRVAACLPTNPIRETQALRTRHTRAGSRLQRLESSAVRKPERKIWKCALCKLTLTSAKAKTDHIGGRRHKARLAGKESHFCHPCGRDFITELDLERHQKGRRHLAVVSSQNR
jgi:Zinc-finger double-stranded RNA-binding/Zinc-finger of C2H2 type